MANGSVADLIQEATEAGLALSVDGDRLKVNGRGDVRRDLLERIKEHKPDVIRELQARHEPDRTEAVENVYTVFPGTQVIPTRRTLSPAGWQKAFLLCPPGSDRDRLITLWATGQVSAETRDGTLHLLVTTPEGAVVTIQAGDSGATKAVMAAFQVDGSARYEVAQ